MATIAQAPTINTDALTDALSGLLAASVREKPIERSVCAPDQLRGRLYQLLRNVALHPHGRLEQMARDAMDVNPRAVFYAADDVIDAALDALYADGETAARARP